MQKARTKTALHYRHENTCEWALELEEFRAWATANDPPEPKLLWIYGGPGFGKTFMSAWIIQHLKKTAPNTTAYYFCVADNQLTRDPYAALRSWLVQLLEKPGEALLAAMEGVHGSREKEQTVTQMGLWDLFEAVGKTGHDYTFVIDGLPSAVTLTLGHIITATTPEPTSFATCSRSSRRQNRVFWW